MAQLTVYIDDLTLKQIEKAAKREHRSISKWVKNRLVKSLENTWPENYFKLFGTLSGKDLDRPKQSGFSEDLRQANL